MNYTTKTFVKHFRYTDNGDGSLSMYRHRRNKHTYYTQFYPVTKGGKTEVIIQVFDEHSDPLIKFVGVAKCSLNDNFCYKLGRNIAFGRALKQLDEWKDNNNITPLTMKYL